MTASNGDIDAATLVELHRLARSSPRSGRAAVAKASAIRTLERLGRGRRSVPPMPDGWHPMPGSAWEELDACDPVETREHWWRSRHGGR